MECDPIPGPKGGHGGHGRGGGGGCRGRGRGYRGVIPKLKIITYLYIL